MFLSHSWEFLLALKVILFLKRLIQLHFLIFLLLLLKPLQEEQFFIWAHYFISEAARVQSCFHFERILNFHFSFFLLKIIFPFLLPFELHLNIEELAIHIYCLNLKNVTIFIWVLCFHFIVSHSILYLFIFRFLAWELIPFLFRDH